MADQGEGKGEAQDASAERVAHEGNEILKIVSAIPETGVDVAREQISQLRDFRDRATDALNILERQHESMIAAYSHSEDYFHRACQDTRNILRDQLDKDPDREERQSILDLLMQLVQMQKEKDTESKNWLGSFSEAMSARVVVAAAAAAATAVAVAVAVVNPAVRDHITKALSRD